MPQLPHSIELHDSLLTAVTLGREALYLKFRPAYVHQGGKGWRQDADLVIVEPVGQPERLTLPCRLSDGTLKTAKGPYHNLLNLPLDDPGPVQLWLELADGNEVQLQGSAVRVELHGDPSFIESFS